MRYLLIFSIVFTLGTLIDNVACISEDDEELVEKIHSESDKILKKMKTEEKKFLDDIKNKSERKRKERQFSEKMKTFRKNLETIQDEISYPEDNN